MHQRTWQCGRETNADSHCRIGQVDCRTNEREEGGEVSGRRPPGVNRRKSQFQAGAR